MKYRIKRIAVLGLLIALEIVLSRVLPAFTIPPLIKASFAFIPIVVAGYLYGPLWAGAAAAIADIIGTFMLPLLGAYQPWFTITAFLVGAAYGAFLHERKVAWRNAVVSAVVVCVLLRIGLNCCWFYIMFGWPYVVGYLPGLLATHLSMIVVQTGFIMFFARAGNKIIDQTAHEKLGFLRQKARNYFRGKPDLRDEKSAKIIQKCLDMPEYLQANTVFCFVGTELEINTTAILERAFSDVKTVCVPKCETDGTMTARLIKSFDDLTEKGKFGILEPGSSAQIIDRHNIDVAFIPCSAIDRNHNRLGKGGRYYDNYLKDSDIYKVGLCPSALATKRLTARDHDVPVDVAVTEKKVF